VQGADFVTASSSHLPITLEQCQQLMAFIQHQQVNSSTNEAASNSTMQKVAQLNPNTAGSSSTSGIFALNS
jgi:hypothetical protein